MKLDSFKEHIKNKRKLEDYIKRFNELYSNLEKSKLLFNSRVNQTVMLETNLTDLGSVSIVYLMDKEIVCIFKDNKCSYTSDILSKDFNERIMNKIHENYGREINDVVDILGVTISRTELDAKLKDFEEKFPKMDMSLFNKRELSDIEEIIEDNENKLDVDTILDKISKIGMDKLTKEELNFLKTQSNK